MLSEPVMILSLGTVRYEISVWTCFWYSAVLLNMHIFPAKGTAYKTLFVAQKK